MESKRGSNQDRLEAVLAGGFTVLARLLGAKSIAPSDFLPSVSKVQTLSFEEGAALLIARSS